MCRHEETNEPTKEGSFHLYSMSPQSPQIHRFNKSAGTTPLWARLYQTFTKKFPLSLLTWFLKKLYFMYFLFGYLLGCFLSPPILFDSSKPYFILPIQYEENIFAFYHKYFLYVQCKYTFDALSALSFCKENKRKNIKRRLFKIYAS